MSGTLAGKTSGLRVTPWLGAGLTWRHLTSHVGGLMLAVAGTSAGTVSQNTSMRPLHMAWASSQHGRQEVETAGFLWHIFAIFCWSSSHRIQSQEKGSFWQEAYQSIWGLCFKPSRVSWAWFPGTAFLPLGFAQCLVLLYTAVLFYWTRALGCSCKASILTCLRGGFSLESLSLCSLLLLLRGLGVPPRQELTSPFCASLEVRWGAGRYGFGRFLDVLSGGGKVTQETLEVMDVAPLGGRGCPGPCCGLPPLWDEVASGAGWLSCECQSPWPLAFYQDCPRGGHEGVTELSPCSGLGNKVLDLVIGLRQPFSLFSSSVPGSMASGEYSKNAISRVGAVAEWREDGDAHWANGPLSLAALEWQMPNSQTVSFASRLDTCWIGMGSILEAGPCVTLTCRQAHFMEPLAHLGASGAIFLGS